MQSRVADVPAAPPRTLRAGAMPGAVGALTFGLAVSLLACGGAAKGDCPRCRATPLGDSLPTAHDSTPDTPAAAGTGTVAMRTKPCDLIDGATARSLVAAGAQLVDVRSPAEYAAGHLDSAINLPLPDLTDQQATLPKDRPLIVYCASGHRARQATLQLCEAGLRVYDLGPMSAWGS